MKALRIIFILLLTQKIAFSQNTIKGKVLEEDTKEAVIGATIYFPDLKTGTVTDLDGNFLMQKLPKGKLVAQISAIGYGQKVISVNSSDTTNVQIFLAHSVTEMQS